MAEEVAALSVRLEATAARFERDMRRARDSLERTAGRMEGRAGRLNTRLESVGRRFGIGISPQAALATTAIVAVTKSVVDLVRNGDKLKRLEGRFTALTGSADRASRKIQDIFRIGANTGTPIDGVASALTRFTIASEAIGATDEEVARLTESIVKLGVIGGGTTQEIQAGAVQLGQALASGRLQGDELRSILENIPLVARQIADGLGVGIGQLREMGKEGELTADKVFGALLDGADDVDRKFSELPVTVDRAANQLANSWAEFTAELDKSLGVSNALASVLSGLSGLIRDVTSAIGGGQDEERLLDRITKLQEVEAAIARRDSGNFFDSLVAPSGLDEMRASLISEIQRINEEINSRGLNIHAPTVSPLPTKTKKTKRKGGRSSARQRESTAAQDVAAQIEDRIRLLNQELQLVGLSEEAAARLSAQFDREAAVRELLNAAKEEGATITEEEIAAATENARRVEELTVQLHQQQEAYRQVQEAQSDLKEDLDNLKDSGVDALAGLITGTLSWKDALVQVLQTLIEIAKQDLTDIGNGRSGGLLGQIFGFAGSALGLAGGSFGGGFGDLASTGLAPGSVDLSNLTFAKGGVFRGGKVTPFANGGIVSSPTLFPMANGAGLMGEAGPEAIMPLTRGADGQLGVKAQGGRNVSVTLNINGVTDFDSFRRSKGQIDAMMARSLQSADRSRN